MPIPSDPPQPIGEVLRHVARRAPHAPAIMAPGLPAVTYESLLRALDEIRGALNRAGFGRGDRVALVVPDGPELAVASVAVAASTVCIPLNPKYREQEYRACLADAKPSVLVVDAHLDSPARQAAQHIHIPVIELEPGQGGAALSLTLTSQRHGEAFTDGFAGPHDTAFVFHTSGTTARPKRVPLTHAHLWTRVQQRVAVMELTERDRFLNLLPLYHDSGLELALATLESGGIVFCPPRFDADAFFVWLDEFCPTWYSAVPALQRAILSRAKDHGAVLGRSGLRFVRTGTGLLAPRFLDDIERVFSAPLIQTYGITEVGTVCSSPLPPHPRKAGSVGVPAGPEVAIIDDRGARLPRGTVGEVVVRGPNVFGGYEDDAVATAAAFSNGWFRTGDLGRLDADGYLFLEGRLKDLINRGGEKISPGEVEETLCAHPAVMEAAVFPVPHPTLGEDVAAAVVLRDGTTATEGDLRTHVGHRLTDFKVPSRVLAVGEIPKGPTGKIHRSELAKHFDSLLAIPFKAPGDPLEAELARIWAAELGIGRVGAHDNFFELGGDSLRATRLCASVQAVTGRAISVATVYQRPTVAELAEVLRRVDAPSPPSSLVPIQADGSWPPLFCMHGQLGYAHDYTLLAPRLGSDQPVYGLRAWGTDGTRPPHTRIEDMATEYVREIREFFPQGPYLLCGYSFAGILAWEVAQQLHAQGQRVALLALLDARLYVNRAIVPGRVPVLRLWRRRIVGHLDGWRGVPSRERFARGLRLASLRQRRTGAEPLVTAEASKFEESQSPAVQAFVQMQREARRVYLPRPYPGPITVILARQPDVDLRYDPRLPGPLAGGPMEIHEVPGGHGSFLREPRVRVLARVLRGCIDRAIGRGVRPAPPFHLAPGPELPTAG